MPARPDEPAPSSWDDGIEVLDREDLLGIGLGSPILIADDDTGTRLAYEAALAPLGRDVIVVGSGTQALATLLEKDVALILLDIQMPDMGGLEAARMLRSRARNKGTPLIFITGMSSNPELVREAYALGAFDFVLKPIDPDVLRAKVRLYLQLQDRTRDVQRQRKELGEARRRLEAEQEDKARTHAADVAIARRLEKLQEATAALAEARTPAEVAAVTVRLGAEAMSAPTAALWLLRPDGTLTLESSHALPEGYLERWPALAPDTAHPARRVFDRGTALWIEGIADYERDAPEIVALTQTPNSVVAFSCVPLVHGGKPIGALTFAFREDHRFPDEERRFVMALVRACEQALERARLYVAESEARQRAEAASARKDELLAMLGHELRNPLAAIVSALELVKLREAPLGRELAIVDRQARHLTHLVHALVDVSRLVHGKVTLTQKPVPLAAAVHQAIEDARASQRRQLAIAIPQELAVQADPDRLQQVLANLLSNAVAYTPSAARIEIRARAEGDVVEIEVRDDGIGIPAALLPDVFDAFVQGERDIARAEGGLGVGLTIVRALVELHGGTIAVRSDGEGQGATFVLRWPRAEARAAEAPVAQPRPLMAGLLVLVVDDNVDAADMLAAILRLRGHDAIVAHDARAALQIVESISPDVALLDVGLPDLDGYELVTRLRAKPSCATTTMVAVTGYAQAADRDRALAAGFDQHHAKPIDVRALTAILDAVPRRVPN